MANDPMRASDLIPFGLSGDDALLVGAAVGLLVIGGAIANYMIERDRFGPRLKMIQERRAELKGEMTAARRRKKRHEKFETMTFIRQVVSKLKLLQQHQVDQLQKKLSRRRRKPVCYHLTI